MSKSALDSLTAQYTDSENDDQEEDSNDSQVIIPKLNTPSQTPEKLLQTVRKKIMRSKKSVRRLVSYQDDALISGEDDESVSELSNSSESEASGTSQNANGQRNGNSPIKLDRDTTESQRNFKISNNLEKSDKYAHYGFTLPPESKSIPDPDLSAKIQNLYHKMDTNRVDMNRIIQERKEFRNPSIYEKLIQFCDINEFGTNYPPELYDPLQWGAESFYEELARVQKNEMVKRQKDRKDTDKIEHATALARKVEEEAKKRKSKWDQPAPLTKPALTTTVTGTKGTVISAFGSLPKKAAM